jgi:hypothetical protein
MSETNVLSTCFMTPTHIGDLRQFEVLRRSIQLFAPGFHHIALVNTEDCAQFNERFRGDRSLEIVRTADVLPAEIERRRRKSGLKWFTGRWLHKHQIRGWHAQQLMKLFALAACPCEAAAFIDSDVFVCRPLSCDYFCIDGRLKLFRRKAVTAEGLDFDIATHEILGNPLHQVPVTELYDYIYSPATFRKSTAVRLFAEFERRRRSTWVRRFLAQKRPSEYHLLGYSATVLEGGSGYHLVECNPDDLHHSIRFPEDRAHLAAEIQRMEQQPKPFALIQSSLRLDNDRIVEAFEAVEKAYRAAANAQDPAHGRREIQARCARTARSQSS